MEQSVSEGAIARTAHRVGCEAGLHALLQLIRDPETDIGKVAHDYIVKRLAGVEDEKLRMDVQAMAVGLCQDAWQGAPHPLNDFMVRNGRAA